MGAEHCNSDLVHLSMLVMWVSSQFMGSSCSIADVLQVMIGPKGLMNHFCGSGEGDITFSKKDRERRALAAINADILDECLYMCSNGVQGEGSIDAKAPFGILEMNDGGLYCLCSWAVDLRRLADPFVSIGLLSHRELIDNFLSHSMSAPVQRAVFLTEYWYGAECVYDYESAWALGHAVAEIEREPPPPLTDSSKLSWWVLMWLRFICISDVENGGSSCASVASVLMAYLQGFTMGPGGSAADEDIWNKTLVEEVVLGLDGLQSGCSLPKWLKPMRHLVSRDASPYSFASALGRCLGAVNAPISAVLKIFNMYIDAACATEHDPYLKAAPGNMAAGVGADAAAFLRGWEEQAEFTLCMSSMHTRENVSRCLTSACTRSSTIKKVMAPLVYDWIRALGMDMPMPIGPTAMTGATIFQSLQKISQWEPSSMSRTGSAVF
uniref:Uncharacterized protein n=1 Tax=Strombidinopsis acuminata TaxID=141414 RepID=A0A7S3SUG4_9SPIT